MIRTRFAPSPTGMLHIGGARTALFSWLYARKMGGEFVLRVEDTDKERSTDASTQVILDGMRWLGLDWDGDVVYQGSRQDKHIAAIEKLLSEGKAYKCYCSVDRLDKMRKDQKEKNQKQKYDGMCRGGGVSCPDAPYVIRFRSPDDGETSFSDIVLGDVSFPNSELDDLILMRSDGTPTYNLAVVVDDYDMGISHVVRGSDHLNNTPRQIQLYDALGYDIPKFAHIPLIFDKDGKKMSKRDGAAAITNYRNQGYLPSATLNYLARLGWSHGDQEVFSKKDLISLFDLDQVGSAPARFDESKLNWLNAHWIKNTDPSELVGEVTRLMSVDLSKGPPLADVIPCLQERSKDLIEMANGARLFYSAPISYDPKAVKKNFKENTWGLIDEFVSKANASEWSGEAAHRWISDICSDKDISMGKLAQPIRILVSGGSVTPPIDDTLGLLGRDEVLKRINRGVESLKDSY